MMGKQDISKHDEEFDQKSDQEYDQSEEKLLPLINTGDGEVNILFLGNPGGGKSTISNSKKFRSGVTSDGIGLTRRLGSVCINILDTPGLVDLAIAKEANIVAESALKRKGKYKINFVVEIEGNFISADDVNVINQVCKSIISEFEYGIIVNKVSPRIIKVYSDPQKVDNFKKRFKKQPSSILFLPL